LALYVDTSCFLKLFFPEPESARVAELISAETRAVVSTLVRLETLGHVLGRVAGGLMTRSAGGKLIRRIDQTIDAEPYDLVSCPGSIIEVAEAQVRPLAKPAHCRTLDRLHLATMHVLGLQRLLTNDDRQAAAANALGFEVLSPR